MYSRIDSKDNNIIKQIVRLASNKNYRDQLHLSVAYGYHLVEAALEYGVLKKLLVDEKALVNYSGLIQNIPDDLIYLVSSKIMDKVNLLESKVDLVGVVEFPTRQLSSSLYSEDCLVLENIQDPGNLGAILRIAKASGVNNIIISKNSVDLYNPKVLRSSQGAIFGLNVYAEVDIVEFIKNCSSADNIDKSAEDKKVKYKSVKDKSAEIKNPLIIATVPNASDSLYKVNLSNKPVVWVFGNEGAGLSELVLSMIKQQVSIPMQNNTESLNVAMAVSVCLFEQLRQRLE
ncbi:MAG: methyltransferase, TrmH family [Pseudomonadota bacterium]|nr:methyltransferase, TrmH family [Pseudomonadota bacterium]